MQDCTCAVAGIEDRLLVDSPSGAHGVAAASSEGDVHFGQQGLD